jgi:hypothetical protein
MNNINGPVFTSRMCGECGHGEHMHDGMLGCRDRLGTSLADPLCFCSGFAPYGEDDSDTQDRTDLCEYCGNAVIRNSCDCGRIVDVEREYGKSEDHD